MTSYEPGQFVCLNLMSETNMFFAITVCHLYLLITCHLLFTSENY